MPSFRDVIAREKATDKDREKKDQQNYENKVKELLTSCKNFNEYLKDNLKAQPNFSTIAENFKKDEMFGKQMKKNKLTSRTSRILNEMCKKISKIEGEYNPKEPLEFFEAFKFTPKKANSKTGRIKRSAIDDAEVVKFFSQDLSITLQNIAYKLAYESRKAIALGNKSLEKSNKLSEGILTQISNTTNIVNEFNKVKEKANKEKLGEKDENAEKQVSNGVKSAAALETLKTNLTDLQNKIDKELKNFKEAIKKPVKDADNINKLVTSLNDMNKNAEDTKNKLEKKTTELQTLTETLDNDIDDATGPFNKKTETFVVSSVEDFAKIAEYKSKIKFLYIEGDVTYVQASVGRELNNLQYVNLSSKVKEIRDDAFNGLDKLETVVVDKSNPGLSVFRNAFKDCTKLGLFDNLNCAKSIRTNAFAGCTSLKMITVGKATNISEGAFSGCTQLETVELGTVTEINNNTFKGCSKLKTINNTQSVTSIKDSAFQNCTSLTNITFEGAESINATAFSGCTSLEKVELKSAKSIGDNAFNGCIALNTIDLRSVKSQKIGKDAFTGCTALTTVFISSTKNDSKYVKHTILKQSGLARSGYHIFTRAFAKEVNFIPST